jgi:hypothetical protein
MGCGKQVTLDPRLRAGCPSLLFGIRENYTKHAGRQAGDLSGMVRLSLEIRPRPGMSDKFMATNPALDPKKPT